MIQMNLSTKDKPTHRHRTQIYVYQRGKGWGGVNQRGMGWGGVNEKFGISRYTLLYIK